MECLRDQCHIYCNGCPWGFNFCDIKAEELLLALFYFAAAGQDPAGSVDTLHSTIIIALLLKDRLIGKKKTMLGQSFRVQRAFQ